MATLESLEKQIEVLADTVGRLDTKIDTVKFDLQKEFTILIHNLENRLDEKIDDLAAMTAQGFTELRNDFKAGFGNHETRIGKLENTASRPNLAW